MSLATIDQTTAIIPAPTPAGGPVTLRDELELWHEAFDFAKAIAPTDFVPKALRNNPAAVMACIIKGHEIGVSALHALSSIHIIEGRACLSAEVQRALVLSKGHELWTEDHTITRVTLCGRRRGGDHVQKVTWTMDDAKRANLAGKAVWRAHPRPMLLARCSGELARIMFADVLAGMSYNVEELTDGVDDVLELAPGEPDETKPAPRARTRRTTKATKSAAAEPGRPAAHAASPAPAIEPGGPPPPLPGEEGYEVGEAVMTGDTITDAETGEHLAGPVPVPSETEPETAPQSPAADSPVQPSTATAERPRDTEPAPDAGEPAAVVTRRAQAIAMQARDAGVDHHQVVYAVTNGNKASAKALTAAEADAVLHALVDIRAGRLALLGAEGEGWYLVEPDPADEGEGEGEPEETKTEEYQRRIRDLKAQKAELDRGGQQALPDPDERSGP